MMRQHSKVVHASSGDVDIRASKMQERMASSVSVDWGAKRAPQNPVVCPNIPWLIVEERSPSAGPEENFQGNKEQYPCSGGTERA